MRLPSSTGAAFLEGLYFRAGAHVQRVVAERLREDPFNRALSAFINKTLKIGKPRSAAHLIRYVRFRLRPAVAMPLSASPSNPALYTAQVSGVNNSISVALVELHELP